MASDFGKSTKIELTATRHTLAFDKLSPADFERLCLWLVEREGYERAEYLGEAGNENGRDVVAWQGDRRVVFQCKRVQAFGLSHAKKEITKLRALPKADQPHELVFVVSKKVSTDVRQKRRDSRYRAIQSQARRVLKDQWPQEKLN